MTASERSLLNVCANVYCCKVFKVKDYGIPLRYKQLIVEVFGYYQTKKITQFERFDASRSSKIIRNRLNPTSKFPCPND